MLLYHIFDSLGNSYRKKKKFRNSRQNKYALLKFWKLPLWKVLTPAKRKTLVISVKTIFLLLVESISVSSSYGERNILREVPFPSWVPALLQGQMNMLEFIVTTGIVLTMLPCPMEEEKTSRSLAGRVHLAGDRMLPGRGRLRWVGRWK